MAYGSSSGGGSGSGDGYVQGKSTFKGFSSRADQNNFKLYDFALIKQDLINRLSVRKGERVENPEFGTIIYDVLFEPLTEEIVVSEFEHGIAVQATIRYVPYNIVEKLTFSFDENSTLRLS